MTRFLCILFLASLLWSGCRKDTFALIESKLHGTWQFSDAHRRTFDLFAPNQSLMGDYRDHQITFLNTKEILYREENGKEWTGIWDLRTVTTTNNDGDSGTDYIIPISLVDSAGTLRQYTWEVRNPDVGNCLRVEEQTVDYIYCFELQRQ